MHTADSDGDAACSRGKGRSSMGPKGFPTLIALLVLCGCGGSEDAPPASLSALFNGGAEVIDLTHALSGTAPYWPGPDESPFRHDTLSAHDDGAPRMAAYSVPEHFGTHFDAPVHGGVGLASVDQVELGDLFAPAVVVDVTEQASRDPDYELSTSDLDGWEQRHGRIPHGAVVLMRSGWALRWEEGPRYYNQGEDGRLHFPGFSADAAQFLIDERDIVGIGVDTGSVDPGRGGFPVHRIVNGSGLYHLENVADLSRMPEAGAFLIVAPVKIEGGSGGQVRLFGVIPGI